MYQVTIYDGPNDKKGLVIQSSDTTGPKVISKGLKLGINTINSFTFDLSPVNPGYAKIKPKTTLIEVLDVLADEIVFRGRALSPEETQAENMAVSATFLFVSELDYLHDSIQEYKKVQNTTPKDFLKMILDVHNAQVEDYKKFYVGDVDVTNSTDNVYRFIDDTADTFETITDKLLSRDSLGGELSVSYKDGKRYLNWKKNIGGEAKQKIELTKNIISMTRKQDADAVVTRLTPRGARLETEEHEASTPRLDIKSVNDGKAYLDGSVELIATFGIVGAAETWDDVTKPEILKSKGEEWLSNQVVAIGSFTLKALDLGMLGLAADRFKVGWTYQVFHPILNINYPIRIEELTLDVSNPVNSSLALGDKKLKLSDYNAQAKRLAASVKALQDEIKSNYLKLTGLTQQLLEAETQLDELKKAVESGSTEVTNKLQELQDTLDLIQGGLIDPTEIVTLKSEIAAIKQELVSVKSKNTEQDTEITTLKQSNKTLTDNQKSLEIRVKALEDKNTGGK